MEIVVIGRPWRTVSARHAVRPLQQVRKAQLPLRQRRRARIAVFFQAFFSLNLKTQIRKGRTRAFWSRLMAAEIYAGTNPTISPGILHQPVLSVGQLSSAINVVSMRW